MRGLGVLVTLVTLAALGGVAVGAPAGSASAARDPLAFEVAGEPVDVRADRLDLDLASANKTASLAGHVVVRRGELTLRCPRLEARFRDGPQLTWAKGDGGVSLDVKGTHAEAEEVEVDLATRTLVLRGKVVVQRAGSHLSADGATIDLATSCVALTGVRGTLSSVPASSGISAGAVPAAPAVSAVSASPPSPAQPSP